MYYKCCIPNCGSKRVDQPLHKLPVNEDLRKKWLDAIICHSQSADLGELKKLLVCHKHFEKKFQRGSTRIKMIAVPTLFTVEEITSGIPRVRESENITVDHAYVRKMHYDHSYHKPAKLQVVRSPSPEDTHLMDITNTDYEDPLSETNQPSELESNACLMEFLIIRPDTSTNTESDAPLLETNKTPMLASNVWQTEHGEVAPDITNKASEVPLLETNKPSELDSKACLMEFLKIGPDFNNKPPEAPLLEGNKPTALTSNVCPMGYVNIAPAPDPQGLATSTSTADILTDLPPRPVGFYKRKVKPSSALNNVRGEQRRKRLIQKYTDLTPSCRHIYTEYKKLKRQLAVKEKALKALKFSKEDCFNKLTKDMNSLCKTFFKMQVNLCSKNKGAFRFSLDEKLLALSIMEQSKKTYKFLQKIFILPGKTTLQQLTIELQKNPEINSQHFKFITDEEPNEHEPTEQEPTELNSSADFQAEF